MIYGAIAAIAYLIIAIYLQGKEYRRITKELIDLVKETQGIVQSNAEKWSIERQSLLDRIQSPTFSEYKHQEARIIKAKSGVQDVVIEQL